MDGKRAVSVSSLILLVGVGVYATMGLYHTTGLGAMTGLDLTAAETPDSDRGSGGVAVALSGRGCPDDTARDPGSLTVVPDAGETGGAEGQEAETGGAEMRETEASGVRSRGFVLNTTVVSESSETPVFTLSRSHPDVYTLTITTDPADERSQVTPLYTPTCPVETTVTVWGRTPTPPDRLRVTLDETVLLNRSVPDHRVVWSFPRVVGVDTTVTADDRTPRASAPDTDG